MHRLPRIDRHRIRHIHFQRVSRLDLAGASVDILLQHAIVLHHQRANWCRHPAILITMIVNGAGLPNLPADRHQFIEAALIDQVPRVMLAVPDEVWSQALWRNRMFAQKALHHIDMLEAGRRQLAEFGGEVLNRQLALYTWAGYGHNSPYYRPFRPRNAAALSVWIRNPCRKA